MKIEKFSDNSKKIKGAFVIGLVLGISIIIILNLLTSKAKYRNTQSINIATGKVSYSVSDLNIVAMYKINDDKSEEKLDEVPGEGYILNSEKSKCTIKGTNGEEEKDSKITIEYVNNEIKIDHMTKKGTKCYIYFEKKITAEDTLAKLNKTSQTCNNDYSKVATSDETKNGLCEVEDGMYGGTSYYWRGAVTDNYVKFAGYYWRIIRINGDGSIRIIYDGTSIHENGTQCSTCSLGNKAFNIYSDNNTRLERVGLKYTDGDAHGSGTESLILGSESDETTLYGWYKKNIVDKNLESKVDKGGMFCGDRINTSDGSKKWSDNPKDEEIIGKSDKPVIFGAYMRLYNEKNPTLECRNNNDIYGTKKAPKGNKSLDYPVGLITVDEAAFAGGIYGDIFSSDKSNNKYYLYTGEEYWTMSPSRYSDAGVFSVSSTGCLSWGGVYNLWNVRPVINLPANTEFKEGSDGTKDHPYEVL